MNKRILISIHYMAFNNLWCKLHWLYSTIITYILTLDSFYCSLQKTGMMAIPLESKFIFVFPNSYSGWKYIILCKCSQTLNDGPVLSDHPLLIGQFSKSWFFSHTHALFVTSLRRPPLLSGRFDPVAVLCYFHCLSLFFVPVFNGHPEHNKYALNNYEMIKWDSLWWTISHRNTVLYTLEE